MQIIYRLWAVLLLVGGIAGGAFAQTRVSGKVVDALNNEPVIGASISVVNEKTGTLTDADGNFVLEVKELPTTLQVNFIGYREQQIDVYDSSEPVVVALSAGRICSRIECLCHFGTAGSLVNHSYSWWEFHYGRKRTTLCH